MKKIVMMLAMALLPMTAVAATFPLTANGIASNQTFVLNLQQAGVNNLSAQATYSLATIPAQSFTDGGIASGSLTVGSLTGLSTALATDSITVVSTSSISGAVITMPGFVFTNGVNWGAGINTSSAAISLGAAIAQNPNVTVVVTGNVIAITAASPGSWANSIAIKSSNANITVASPTMTGGYDNAFINIGGVVLMQGRDWAKGAGTSAAATSIAAAINANTRLSSFLTAAPSSNSVAIVANQVGSAYNFTLGSSTAAITVSGSALTGGSNINYSIGSGIINIPSHGFTTALPLLYTGTPAINPLVSGTTYYAIPLDANDVELATTAAHAIAGDSWVVITSSNAPSHTYTLSPLAISGTAALQWQQSNDGVNYTNISGQSASFGTPYTTTTSYWDFGSVTFQYLRLAITAPTTGAINLSVVINGYGPSDFLRKSGDSMTGPLLLQGSAYLQFPDGTQQSTAANAVAIAVSTAANALAISNETSRAESAESLLLPKSGSQAMTGPFTPYSRSSAQLALSTPTVVGQEVFNTTIKAYCQGNGTTTAGDWKLVLSTNTACQ